MSIWMRVGEGSKPFAHATTSPTSRPPVYVACFSNAGGAGGPRSGRGCQRLGRAGYHVTTGPLQEKSELHRGAKAWKGAQLEKHCAYSRHFCANGNYMPTLTRHAYETCKYAREFNNFFANLIGVSNHSSYILLVFFFLIFWRRKHGKRANRHEITGKTGQKPATCACSFKSAGFGKGAQNCVQPAAN